jgi:O-antigen/teichoic acid export membrane protein
MGLDARSLPAVSGVQPISRRIKWNSFWLLLARLITQAQLILFTVLVARGLGVIGFGQYAFVAALIVLGNVATTFGTDTLLIREVARTRQADDGLIPAALWIQLALSAAWLIVIGISADVLSGQSPEVVLALKVYSLSLIPLAFFTVFTAVLRAHERMDVYLLLNVVVAFAQLGGAWWVLRSSGDLLALVMALNGVQVIAAVAAGALCRLALPAFHIDWAVTRHRFRQVASLAWPFALLSVLAVIDQRLGILMLSTLGNEIQAGWFAAATRVIEPVKLLHFAVLGALLPALAHLTAAAATVQQSQIAARVYRRSLLFLLMFSALAAALLLILAQPIVTLLFGASYTDSVILVQILALSLIPYTFSASMSVRLVTQGKEQRVLWATAISLAVAFVLNRFLIPSCGAGGAALTDVLGESVLAGTMFVLRR